MKQPQNDKEWHLYKFGMTYGECSELDSESSGEEPICKVCGYAWAGHSDHHCSQLASDMVMDWQSKEFVPYDMPIVATFFRVEVSTLPSKSTVKDVFHD